jgi:hypothetical protein
MGDMAILRLMLKQWRGLCSKGQQREAENERNEFQRAAAQQARFFLVTSNILDKGPFVNSHFAYIFHTNSLSFVS